MRDRATVGLLDSCKVGDTLTMLKLGALGGISVVAKSRNLSVIFGGQLVVLDCWSLPFLLMLELLVAEM